MILSKKETVPKFTKMSHRKKEKKRKELASPFFLLLKRLVSQRFSVLEIWFGEKKK